MLFLQRYPSFFDYRFFLFFMNSDFILTIETNISITLPEPAVTGPLQLRSGNQGRYFCDSLGTKISSRRPVYKKKLTNKTYSIINIMELLWKNLYYCITSIPDHAGEKSLPPFCQLFPMMISSYTSACRLPPGHFFAPSGTN